MVAANLTVPGLVRFYCAWCAGLTFGAIYTRKPFSAKVKTLVYAIFRSDTRFWREHFRESNAKTPASTISTSCGG
jgi:hypothetical protein